MSEAEKPVCPLCNGAEWIPVDNLKSRPCQCLHGRRLKHHLGLEIATAVRVKSPLYQPGNPPVDRTVENLFLKGRWSDALSHLQWALGCKFNTDPNHTFKIITDEEILRVRLGHEAYDKRSKESRETRRTYNSLADLVEDPQLLIIRLGVLRYKNIAMAGFFNETLSIRGAMCKPVWVVEDLTEGKFFGEGHRAYNDEVAEYVRLHFDVVDLRARNAPAVVVPVSTAGDDSVGIGPTSDGRVEDEPPSKETFFAEATNDPMEAMRKNSHQERFKPNKWKKRSGGGPMGDL